MTVLSQLSNYGVGFQIKVLASLLRHKEFLQNIFDILDVKYFDNPAHKWIIERIIDYYNKYNTAPTYDALSVEYQKIDNDILKVSVREQIRDIRHISAEDQDYVEQEFANFCRNQHLKDAIMLLPELLDKGHYDDIRQVMDTALKAGMEKNIGHEYEKDVETRYRVEERKAIPTPWPHISDLLMGGLGGGDLGIIFGNPGGGKSWMLTNMGAQAVREGKNVCHYTLELSEDYMGKRYDAIFTKIEVQKVHQHRKEVEKAISELTGKLVIKEFPMGKASISSIESHIQKCTDLGYRPDLVIIDYVDLLKAKRKSIDKKDEIDDIYISTKGLARELKIPIWTVSQVNRAGAKDGIIEGDKAAGSYNKMMIADFAISLSRKRQDKVNGTGRIHIMKNRYGVDGMTYKATINTSNGEINVEKKEMTEEEIDAENQSTSGAQKMGNSISNQDKQVLNQKFYELETKTV